MKFLAFCLLLGINVGLSVGDVLPVVQPLLCSRNSPNISACYIQAAEAILPRLVSGDYGNGVQGPVLDPYRFELDVNNPNGFQVSIRNGFILGVKSLRLDRLRLSLVKRALCITVGFNEPLLVFGQYKLKMNLGPALDIDGAGSFNATDSPTLRVVFTYGSDPSGQASFIPVRVHVAFNKPVLYLSGLFPGNPSLDDSANTVINSNPFLILNELSPELDRIIKQTVADIASTVLQGATLDELFPA